MINRGIYKDSKRFSYRQLDLHKRRRRGEDAEKGRCKGCGEKLGKWKGMGMRKGGTRNGKGKGRTEEEGEECSRRKECYKRIFKY